MAPRFTIGQLAKSAGVPVQTVRYYERRRLLKPATRSSSGYRLYGIGEARQLRLIKNAQGLGFTLREIGELLSLRVSGEGRCGDMQRKAEAKLRDVEAKLSALQVLARALRGLIRTCRDGQPTDYCPILQSLEEDKVRTVLKGSSGRK